MEIIRRTDIPRYANPGVVSEQLLFPQNSASERLTITRVTVSPGGRNAPHAHASSEQVWVALRGRGTLLLGGVATVPFAEGDVARFAEGDTHGLWNDGPGDFVYLAVTSPPIDFRGAYASREPPRRDDARGTRAPRDAAPPAEAGAFARPDRPGEGVSMQEQTMTRVRVEGFTLSLDGYAAGPDQDLQNPLGVGGTELHQWLFPTRTFQRALFGKDGATGVDDDFAARGFRNVGAWILGRNMFGPIRGAWGDSDWKGWWGDEPPYHVPVFVLTHYARAALAMKGGTTFHFVTGGAREALDRAREAAAGRDVRIGGGPNTIRQYLREGLVDELHLAIAPVLLGRGEPLFQGIDLRSLGYACAESAATPKATHVVLRREARPRT